MDKLLLVGQKLLHAVYGRIVKSENMGAGPTYTWTGEGCRQQKILT
jgi:hypothetical protein